MDSTKVSNGNQSWNWVKILCGFCTKTRNEIFQEPESKSVEERALLNPLILKKVLGFLEDAGDLLNCRQVGSDWKSLATEILLKRRSVTIKICYDGNDEAYCKLRGKSIFYNGRSLNSTFYNKDGETLPLKNLVRVITSAGAGSFPCVSFEIVAGDLKTDDISSFIHFYGGNIQNLKLKFQPYTKKSSGSDRHQVFPDDHSVKNLLCHQLPNLKELEIVRSEIQLAVPGSRSWAFHDLFLKEFELDSILTGTGTETETRISAVLSAQETKKETMMIAKLPKLHKLYIKISDYHNFHDYYLETKTPPKSVIQTRMLASKSVEFTGPARVPWWCRECVHALLSSNQVGKLKNLKIKALGLDLMEKIIEKCPSQLQFEQLDIDFDAETVRQLIKDESMKKRMIRVLNTIFKCAANSNGNKICVHINRPIGFLSDADFEIPVMKNVSSLRLTKLDFENQRGLADIPFFPCSFNLSDSFPNLRSVSLLKWAGEFSSDLLGSNCQIQVLPTVKHLHINWTAFGPLTGFSKLPEIFPNLVQLKVEYITDFPAVAPCLWKFKELEQLTIGIFLDSAAREYSKEKGTVDCTIDSAITGFTMETCQKLRESQEFLEWAVSATKNEKTAEPPKDTKKKSGENLHPPDSGGFSDCPNGESIDLESLRVNPSICDLSKLKKFQLAFHDGDRFLFRKESNFWVSELSDLFAFHLMPQLEVWT